MTAPRPPSGPDLGRIAMVLAALMAVLIAGALFHALLTAP